jgi:hypothetical protein
MKKAPAAGTREIKAVWPGEVEVPDVAGATEPLRNSRCLPRG